MIMETKEKKKCDEYNTVKREIPKFIKWNRKCDINPQESPEFRGLPGADR